MSGLERGNVTLHGLSWLPPHYCLAYGHVFTRDTFLGIPLGKPYCIRCGKKAA